MTEGSKKEILNIWEVIGKIRKLLEQRGANYCTVDNADFTDALQQYQDAVIAVGTKLEGSLNEEEQAMIIPVLEQYCEDIYMLSQCDGSEVSFRKQIVLLREKHREILDYLSKLPTRRMALFLPYKFSMWDSLESIYIAVKEDPDWDAVVVPIPYCECEEGKERQWIYEGPEIYGDMQAISFRDFKIEEQKPDVIYIHNPYDGYNSVTSVPTEYYSDNLKAHCRKLVYVPYFFTNSEFPGIHRNIPTYDNYDYLVVPSQMAADQIGEYIGPNKILAYGSPKIDRMLWMEKNYVLPEEWERRIRGRKSVLYNVGLNSILQNGFQTILKMVYIFNYFKQHQDVVLWWRPHPLIKSTLKTMHPELLGAYEAMERKYILEKIGIYDITLDSNRAIAATDAFIGDYSSMCGLYGILGKPIFLMDTSSMDEPTENDRRKVNLRFPIGDYNGVAKKDGQFYVYATDYRALCLLNPNTMELRFVRKFDDEYCYIQAFEANNTDKAVIYFIPTDVSHKTVEYRIASDTVSEKDTFDNMFLQKGGPVFDIGNAWYVTPREGTVGTRINKENGERLYTNNLNSQLHPFCEYTGDPLLSGAILRLNSRVYQLAYATGRMMITDLETNSSELVLIGDGSGHYSGFVYFEEKFYLFDWNGKSIDIWEPKENKFTKITKMPEGYFGMSSTLFAKGTYAIAGGVVHGRELIILPFLGNMIMSLNIDTNEISPYVIDLPYEEGQRRATYYNDRNNYLSLMIVDNQTLLMQTAYDKNVVRLNLNTKETEIMECLIPEELYASGKLTVAEKASRDGNRSPYYIRENGTHCTLNDMIEFVKNPVGWDSVKQHEASCDGVINADGTCGRRVHEKIKSVL